MRAMLGATGQLEMKEKFVEESLKVIPKKVMPQQKAFKGEKENPLAPKANKKKVSHKMLTNLKQAAEKTTGV